MTHLDWDTINDLVDGRLAPDARASAEEHMEACAECGRLRSRVGSLAASATALRVPAPPPAEAWTAIRGTIEAGKQVAFPGPRSATADVRDRRPRWRANRSVLAASLVLAAGLATVSVVRGRFTPVDAPTTIGSRPVARIAVPADFEPVEQRY